MVFIGSIHKTVIALENLKTLAEEFVFDFSPRNFVMDSLALTRVAASEPGSMVQNDQTSSPFEGTVQVS